MNLVYILVISFTLVFVVSCVAVSRSKAVAKSPTSNATIPSSEKVAVSNEALSTPTQNGFVIVNPTELNITDGTIVKVNDTKFSILNNSIRGVYGNQSLNGVEISFVYRGQSSKAQPLKSGEMRLQLGLKLRAENACNLIYVMWHIEPTQGIFVAMKHNAGMDNFRQCADNGYSTIKATYQQRDLVKPIKVGETHTLRAVIDGKIMHVFADGAEVWTGELPAEALAYVGPVGIRSDNANFDVEFRVSK
jgi:hypothetical protein